jgi:pSer/pThr/pTyr-binding forkhead associated (FHA) protein
MISLDWVLLGFRILTTIILYTFLGLAFFIIWRDLQRAASKTAEEAQSHLLRVVEATGSGSVVVGQAFVLQPVTLLGRDPENTIPLSDVSASARHARLSRDNGRWWLEDLGSRHGTLLNDRPIVKPTSLTNGDIIGIGNFRFRLETMAE